MKEIDEAITRLQQAKTDLIVAQNGIQTLKHYYENALSENQKLKDRVESLNTQIGLLKAENDTLTKNNIDLRMDIQRMQRRSLWDIVTGR